MPVLSSFYGIAIRMYFQQAEHNPPHIHALYVEDVAEIDVKKLKILEGSLPPKALEMVREWISFIRMNCFKFGKHKRLSDFLRLNKEVFYVSQD